MNQSQNSSAVAGAEFAEALFAIKNGQAMEVLSNHLRDVVRAVKNEGGVGLLTLKIKVAPVKNAGSAVTIEIDVQKKLPQPPAGKQVFFALDTGQLSSDNPTQRKLFVEGEAAAADNKENLPA